MSSAGSHALAGLLKVLLMAVAADEHKPLVKLLELLAFVHACELLSLSPC